MFLQNSKIAGVFLGGFSPASLPVGVTSTISYHTRLTASFSHTNSLKISSYTFTTDIFKLWIYPGQWCWDSPVAQKMSHVILVVAFMYTFMIQHTGGVAGRGEIVRWGPARSLPTLGGLFLWLVTIGWFVLHSKSSFEDLLLNTSYFHHGKSVCLFLQMVTVLIG